MSTIFTSTHNSYKWLKYYFNIIFIPIIIFSLTSSNIHLVCFALQLRNPSVSSMGWKWCYGNENVKNAMGKTATLPNAAHVLVYFFVGTAPLRREIAEFDPHIDNVKNRRRLSLLFSLLNLNIFITNSTPGGFVFLWLRPRPHFFFFSVLEKKKYAYLCSVFELFSPTLTFSKPAPFPVSAG